MTSQSYLFLDEYLCLLLKFCLLADIMLHGVSMTCMDLGPLLFYIPYSFVCNDKGVTSGLGIDNPSGAPEFTPRFLVGFMLLDLFVDHCLSFCVSSFF